MNTAEHLVELYYRQNKCFTITDVKVESGNNRQFDILAYNTNNGLYYHIEVSVSQDPKWEPQFQWLLDWSKWKFFGGTKSGKEHNPKSDAGRGKNYLDAIAKTYSHYHIDYDKVIRVWCVWGVKDWSEDEYRNWKINMVAEYGLNVNNFEILSLRDKVIPDLFSNESKSNFDDELLRFITFINASKNKQ